MSILSRVTGIFTRFLHYIPVKEEFTKKGGGTLSGKKVKEWSAEKRLAAIGMIIRLPIPWYVALFLIFEIVEHGKVINRVMFK